MTRAIRDAIGLPSIVLLASMAGWGSLARESALSLEVALGATIGIWGLPGQIAMAELRAAGADLLAVVLAVSLANARFLPMAVSFLPVLSAGLRRRTWLFLLVQLMSINTWAAVLRVGPSLPGAERRRYFVTFAAVCLSAAVTGTVVGYIAAGQLPRPVALGLLFLNPVFFALLLAVTRARATTLALVIGAVVGPPLHLVSPDWGLMATGLIAGTAAFALNRVLAKRSAGS